MSIEKQNQILNNATLLHDKASIEAAIDKMASQLCVDYQNSNPIFLVVMNGGLIFAGKLLPKLQFPAQIDYCHATRYRGETSGGELVWKAAPQMSLQGRHVLLIDDILDEGYTLKAIEAECEKLGAASVKTVVLIEKHHDRKAEPNMKPDYCALTCPDQYIFGCGMDVEHYWRNTEAIYIHNPESSDDD